MNGYDPPPLIAVAVRLVALLSLVAVDRTFGTACSAATTVGYTAGVASFASDPASTETDKFYYIGTANTASTNFDVPCCGFINQWDWYSHTDVSGATVELSVWTPVNTALNKYMMRSQYTWATTVTGAGTQSITFSSPSDEMFIKEGDAIGWRTSTGVMEAIPFKSPGCDTYVYRDGGASYSPLDVVQFVSPITCREYAVLAYIDPGVAPAWYSDTALSVAAGSPETVSIGASGYTGQIIFEGYSADDDLNNGRPDGITITLQSASPASHPFSWNQTAYGTAKKLTISTDQTYLSTGTFTLTFASTDACDTTTTMDVEITVTGTTAEPETTVEVSTAADDTTVAVDETTATSFSEASTAVVTTAANQPPVTNLDNSTEVSCRSDTVGDSVFTFTAYDPEGSSIVYEGFSFSPADGIFDFNETTGDIVIASDIYGLQTEFYTFSISVTDGIYTLDQDLTINITDINTAPEIITYTAAISVNESDKDATFGNDAIISDAIDTSDAENDTLEYTISGDSRFGIDSSTGEIYVKAGSNLNYEVSNSYTLTIKVYDLDPSGARVASSDSQTIIVTVEDIDESPYFVITSFNETVVEAKAGTPLSLDISAYIRDEDGVISNMSYVEISGNVDFAVNSRTGQITFASDYDVDTSAASTTYCSSMAAMETSASLTIEATDNNELSTDVTVYVQVVDANDNSPIFTSNGGSSTVNVNWPRYIVLSNEVVYTVNAVDCDPDENGQVTYYILGDGLSTSYFTVDGITGAVTVLQSYTIATAVPYTSINIVARDGGYPSRQTAFTIYLIPPPTVVGTTTSTTTEATTPDVDLPFSRLEELIALIMGCVIGLLTLALCILCACRHCVCFRKTLPDRMLGKPQPPARFGQPGTDLGGNNNPGVDSNGGLDDPIIAQVNRQQAVIR